jgi:uncharacterized protein DUF3352
MSRRAARFAISLALTALTVTAVGCGGGSSAGAGEPFGVGARAIPAHPLAFADVNLDRGSAAWKNAEALGARFPGWKKLTRQLQHTLSTSSDGTSFAKDIQPWLGDEAAISVTGVNVTDAANPVDVAAYVAVTDDGKLKQVIEADKHTRAAGAYRGMALYRDRTSPDLVAAAGDGALLLSNNLPTLRAEVDAWKGGPSLADDPQFANAMGQLPKDSLVRGYLDGRRLASLISLAALSQMAGPAAPAMPAAQLQKMARSLRDAGAITASFGAEANGLRLTFNVVPEPGHSLPKQLTGAGAAPALIGDVPQNAFAYFGLHSHGADAFAASNPSFGQVQHVTGLDFAHDVAPLLTGDIAGYAGPGLPFSGALLLAPKNPEAAAAAMGRLTAFIAKQQPGLKFHWLPGHRGQVTTLGQGMRIGWWRNGDLIAISNDPHAGRPQATSLGESAAFKTIAAQAGMPDQVSSLAYVDIAGILRAVPMGPTDPNVEHLGGLLLWSSTDGAGAHFTAYLQITP